MAADAKTHAHTWTEPESDCCTCSYWYACTQTPDHVELLWHGVFWTGKRFPVDCREDAA